MRPLKKKENDIASWHAHYNHYRTPPTTTTILLLLLLLLYYCYLLYECGTLYYAKEKEREEPRIETGRRGVVVGRSGLRSASVFSHGVSFFFFLLLLYLLLLLFSKMAEIFWCVLFSRLNKTFGWPNVKTVCT